ncbi:54S ribosomal protein L7, mitochondrial [Leucoagaricus gongylophorus]
MVPRFGRPAPSLRAHLRKDRVTGLPRPPVTLITREFAPCRLQDHYYDTLQSDLMYMTYRHEPRPPLSRPIRLSFDPQNPFSKHRRNPPVGGSRVGKKLSPPSSPRSVIRLEKVVLHTMVKEALQSKSNLLGPIMALRALTGESRQARGRVHNHGVQIVRGRKSVGGWIRPGVPVGAQVVLKGRTMYDFIATLVEFVLPRLREFQGVLLPPPSSNVNSLSAVSGVVSFGLTPQAMGFFPQIEVNQDAYPKMYGMHIHFVTNASGLGAQNRARALVSGFQIPFVRR